MADVDRDVAVARLLAAAMEALPKPLLVSDYRKIIFANASMRSVLRVAQRSQIEGHSALDFLHPDVHEAMMARREIFLRSPRAFSDVPLKLLATDGTAVSGLADIIPVECDAFRFVVVAHEPRRPA